MSSSSNGSAETGAQQDAGEDRAIQRACRSNDLLKGLCRSNELPKILGQGDFVETVLKAAQEKLDWKPVIQALGYDFSWLMDRVSGLSLFSQMSY